MTIIDEAYWDKHINNSLTTYSLDADFLLKYTLAVKVFLEREPNSMLSRWVCEGINAVSKEERENMKAAIFTLLKFMKLRE